MRTLLMILAVGAPSMIASCGGAAVGGASMDAGGVSGDAAGPSPDAGGFVEAGGADSGRTGGDASVPSDGGNGGTSDGGVCAIDPPGASFTFHVHNSGTSDRGLAYGCGGDQPIVLTTPGGSLGIGPESANTCGFTCAEDYQGNPQQGCSDCGSGTGADLAAGSTVDISWDRRVYIANMADPQCVGGQSAVSCALAVAVAPTTAAQAGTLTVCTGGSSSGGPGGGYCGTSEAVPFTVDLTQSEATINVP